jgi:16S rRNA (uracil1498-N3)-methyltransferase
VEHGDRAAIVAFFCDEPLVAGGTARLNAEETRHARVRRTAIGERVRLLDGPGRMAWGSMVRLARDEAVVEIERVENVDPPAPIHLLAPVADRERMLWLAEKAAELGVASWRPVVWHRSRSVTPRGEGSAFHGKVRARMIGALTQSGGAWLPVMHPEASLDRASAEVPTGSRLALDVLGDPILSQSLVAPVSIAVGPEGGTEVSERSTLAAAGFLPVSLGGGMLRFETAAIAAIAITRAALAACVEDPRG